MSSLYLHVLLFASFFFHDPAPTAIYTLSLHDALPICPDPVGGQVVLAPGHGHNEGTALPVRALRPRRATVQFYQLPHRSEEHTSELQSQFHLVCRLLLEKKKKTCRRW